ncbi:hypothetical protein [Desulfosarcina sp.]|uniref:hypothetical protein n=1 Tax=Desulfosarcina sp. TaxID=2027861 RepID=UPI0039709471
MLFAQPEKLWVRTYLKRLAMQFKKIKIHGGFSGTSGLVVNLSKTGFLGVRQVVSMQKQPLSAQAVVRAALESMTRPRRACGLNVTEASV